MKVQALARGKQARNRIAQIRETEDEADASQGEYEEDKFEEEEEEEAEAEAAEAKSPIAAKRSEGEERPGAHETVKVEDGSGGDENAEFSMDFEAGKDADEAAASTKRQLRWRKSRRLYQPCILNRRRKEEKSMRRRKRRGQDKRMRRWRRECGSEQRKRRRTRRQEPRRRS
jgi:hypothetical protein